MSGGLALAARVLHPGDVACVGRGERLETLLGSCIAVVLADPARTVGAMCHVVHAADAPAARPHDTAYADAALACLQQLLVRRGITPRLCDAWVFGGGNMFPAQPVPRPVGDRNARRVLDLLSAIGVRAVQVDVGGVAYRRLGWTVGPDAPHAVCVPV